MIASIRGDVLAAGAGWVVVSVSGMGFRVEVPQNLLGVHVGSELSLFTHLAVREDALTLYGFMTNEQLEIFSVLRGVSGVGPKSALGILSELTPSDIAQAVIREDDKPFRKVSGIGPKTAKLITVQLAGKVQPFLLAEAYAEGQRDGIHASGPASAVFFAQTQVTEALTGLGYSEQAAEDAVRDAIAAGANSEESQLLRSALVLLQNPRMGTR